MTDAQTLLQEGLSAFRARAYDRALQAWRALLDAEPDNQQVQQLVERTEALAAEGHLVHTLKEELADLREELATTRQARNELLIEMARVHRCYQAREARLWRLQEEREWELREALAHAELSSIVGDEAQAAGLDPLERYSSLNQESIPDTLEDAHQEIHNLLQALNQAQQRIRTLESRDTTLSDVGKELDTSGAEEDRPAKKSAATHTRPSRTVPARAAAPRDEPPKTEPARTVPAALDAEPSESSPADIDIPRKSSSKHTQTSRTLAGARHLFEPDDEDDDEEEEDSLSFDGPLIADEWLNAPEPSGDAPPVSDDLVSLVKVVSKASKPTEAQREQDATDKTTIHESDEPALGDDSFSLGATDFEEFSLLESEFDENSIQEDTSDGEILPTAPSLLEDPIEDSVADAVEGEQAPDKVSVLPIEPDATFQLGDEDEAENAFLLEDDSSDAVPDTVEPPPSPETQDVAPSPSAVAPSDDDKPPAVQRGPASTAPQSQPPARSAIPDTARIDAQPMVDKDIADGFSDELTSALGSTPAPPRLFTGVQPELPDIDIFEDEPQVMAPEDLEKYPTAVPVRYKDDASIEDPIARYLLTHVDGVSTFMELRGTVGLPPAAVDRGFRILLAHKVIRVQHQ